MSSQQRPWILLALHTSVLFAACSQTIGLPPPVIGPAQDYFWSSSELANGVNYYVVRNGVGTYHLLTSTDGMHIKDGALNNEVTMVVHSNADSVLIDSIGTNAIFSLPSQYFFGHISPSKTSDTTITLFDTVIVDTVISARDTFFTQITPRDTIVQKITSGDTVHSSLLAIYRPDLDSGMSWQAGILSGPGIDSGVRVFATVRDHVNALLLPPVSSGADSTFGESFQIRYSTAIPGDSAALVPLYWVAYYSRNIGPVLIEQHTHGVTGYTVTQSAQIVRAVP